MPRRDLVAAQVMAACIATLRLPPRVLCVDDETGVVEQAFADRGASITTWHRRAVAGAAATAWPAPDRVDAACVRLPKGREALGLALHAAAALLEPGGKLWLYGTNDEGIRSAAPALGTLCDGVRTLDARRHCRVWEGTRSQALARGSLADFRTRFEADLLGERVTLSTYPGVFAGARIDAGSRLLIEALEKEGLRGRILDFGAGIGVLSAALQRMAPDAHLDLLEVDALAARAAGENVPGARVCLGDGWSALDGADRYDWIVSNPPFHRGRGRDLGVLRELLKGAPERLTRRGRLVWVAPRHAPCRDWLGERFGEVAALREGPRHRVWRAARPRSSRR